ncbi:MAG: two-component system response regulator [Deltaproteobacteria bacterium]|nr:two-component system response regulator [Deltaproteobacteria bacterium]
MRDLSKCTILVVDDTETNIDILMETLGDTYEISVAMDGPTALEYAKTSLPDLILLDVVMPGMDGYEVCRRIKADPKTRHIPIIFVTAMAEREDETRGLELGAIDYLTKPISPPIVLARVKNHLELKVAKEELERQNVILEQKVEERTQQLTLTQEVTIESMAVLAEYRDPETGGHIKRTKRYVRALANRLKDHPRFRDYFIHETIDLLYKSAPLHDIGKIGVPDQILMKPDKLTNEEFEVMKQHTGYGHSAISAAEKKLGGNSFLRFAREIAYTHQEKWDGSGYPQGLKGDEIPISGRLMALADVYDALISKRVYKPPIPHSKAVAIIKEGQGTHFDPDIVAAFIEAAEEFRQIAFEFAECELERQALSL